MARRCRPTRPIDPPAYLFTVVLVLLLPAWAAGDRHDGGAEPIPYEDTLDVEPTDLTYAPDGALYVTSAASGSLFRSDGTSFERVPGTWHRPYGLATLADGRLCLSHDTSDDPLTRRSAVSCGDGRSWSIEAVGLGSGVHGLAATPEGVWAIGWRDTDVEQRDGLLSLIVDGAVVARVVIPAYVPQFAARLPSGALVVSAWREDASGFVGGALLRVSEEGVVEVFNDDLRLPAGVTITREGVWVSDFDTGALVRFDADGVELARHSGWEGPLGITSAPTHALCVAETRQHRVRCLHETGISGGLP